MVYVSQGRCVTGTLYGLCHRAVVSQAHCVVYESQGHCVIGPLCHRHIVWSVCHRAVVS